MLLKWFLLDTGGFPYKGLIRREHFDEYKTLMIDHPDREGERQ